MNTIDIDAFIFPVLSVLFSLDQVNELKTLASSVPLPIEKLSSFDETIRGLGIGNIEVNNSGVYTPDERDIFRPIQYCKAYFAMNDTEWRTREIVHMSALHLEGIVKLIAKPQDGSLPLGALLTKSYVKKQIPQDLHDHLDKVRVLLNLAKHHMGHAKDTHLFSLQNAVFVYFICRKLAMALIPIAGVRSLQLKKLV